MEDQPRRGGNTCLLGEGGGAGTAGGRREGSEGGLVGKWRGREKRGQRCKNKGGEEGNELKMVGRRDGNRKNLGRTGLRTGEGVGCG